LSEGARLSWDISPFGTSREVAAVDGDLPVLEMELTPLRVLLELSPLFTLAVSKDGDPGTPAELAVGEPAGTTSQ
jgi:hypothetical protein